MIKMSMNIPVVMKRTFKRFSIIGRMFLIM